MHFTYVNPTIIHFGQKQIATLKEAIKLSQKILIIYGGGSIKKNGIYEQVTQALNEHDWIEFAGVEANPTKEKLDKAIALVKEKDIDFILAVGGGSVIDGAKYVAAAAKYQGESWDIMTGKHQVNQATPLGVVLTLPATGSESNCGAVITKAATQEKLAFLSPAVQPVFAVLDPDVMISLPERQLINGIVDAWVHICEQYLTSADNAMVQDGYAQALLNNLRVLANQFNQRDNTTWRENLMWTANQALNGLIGVGLTNDWATHMMGHEITALWGVDHARSLAIVQPSLLKNQIDNKRAKLEQMGQHVFGLHQSDCLALRTIDAIENFYHQLGVDTQFKAPSLTKEQAVDAVISQLEKHSMVKLGETGAITLVQSRQILNQAFI